MKLLDLCPFSEIHQAILASKYDKGAADNLGVDPSTLSRYLKKFFHRGIPLTIDGLRTTLSIDTMRAAYLNYDKPWRIKKINLQKCPFSQIHQTVLALTPDNDILTSFGISAQTLTTYLGKFFHADSATPSHFLQTSPIPSRSQKSGLKKSFSLKIHALL